MKNVVLAVLIVLLIPSIVFANGKGDDAGETVTGGVKGTVVTMSGPFTDNDAIKFVESVKAFEQETGIDIQYEGSKEFEASIAIRVEGGNPPDIVDFHQ